MSLALKVLLSPLLVAQAIGTRARAPVLPEPALARTGSVGSGPRLRVLIVGASSGAGVGVASQEAALAGHLSRTLAGTGGVCVHWQLVARSGVNSAKALDLVRAERPASADVAVVALGV